jgi:hypothetical protein
MKTLRNLVVYPLAGIGLAVILLYALSEGDLQVFEDGSYTYSADIPFSQAWRD